MRSRAERRCFQAAASEVSAEISWAAQVLMRCGECSPCQGRTRFASLPHFLYGTRRHAAAVAGVDD